MDTLGEARIDAGLPPFMRAIGALGGIPVVENHALAYDEMYVSSIQSAIIVGELAHFKWRLEQQRLNNLCREAARRHIEAQASRLLGEPWKVGAGV